MSIYLNPACRLVAEQFIYLGNVRNLNSDMYISGQCEGLFHPSGEYSVEMRHFYGYSTTWDRRVSITCYLRDFDT